MAADGPVAHRRPAGDENSPVPRSAAQRPLDRSTTGRTGADFRGDAVQHLPRKQLAEGQEAGAGLRAERDPFALTRRCPRSHSCSVCASAVPPAACRTCSSPRCRPPRSRSPPQAQHMHPLTQRHTLERLVELLTHRGGQGSSNPGLTPGPLRPRRRLCRLCAHASSGHRSTGRPHRSTSRPTRHRLAHCHASGTAAPAKSRPRHAVPPATAGLPGPVPDHDDHDTRTHNETGPGDQTATEPASRLQEPGQTDAAGFPGGQQASPGTSTSQ